MPRVFIPQVTGRFSRNEDHAPAFIAHDYSDLHRFGEPHIIFKRDLYPDNAAELIDDAVYHATHVLVDWKPEDYLCLMGSPLYMAVCSMVMGLLGNTPCKLLRFDKLHGAYYEITIPNVHKMFVKS